MKLIDQQGRELSNKSVRIWRVVQIAVFAVGMAILCCLLFFPSLGILLFWNILIPVAPALLVVAAGVWRNICPLGIFNLLPRHSGLSQRRRLKVRDQGILNLAGVVLLYTIVPLRHAVFNTHGPATAFLIIGMAALGFGLGLVYEWKSAWCSGLCPIHPVEKFYGSNVIRSVPNLHCRECMNCVIPCPDSSVPFEQGNGSRTVYHKLSAVMIAGGLPGFIWGWFHVPDAVEVSGPWWNYLQVYQLPLMGFATTIVSYLVLEYFLAEQNRNLLIRLFATAAVSCYYWYRVPSLFGFGPFEHDGMLVDLSAKIPAWSITAITVTLTAFFSWWLLIRPQPGSSWLIRPKYAAKKFQS